MRSKGAFWYETHALQLFELIHCSQLFQKTAEKEGNDLHFRFRNTYAMALCSISLKITSHNENAVPSGFELFLTEVKLNRSNLVKVQRC